MARRIRTDAGSDNIFAGSEPNPVDGTTGNGDANVGIVIDPASLIGGGSGASTGTGNGTGRRRGRPPGSTNTNKKTASANIDLSGLEGLLFSVHMLLAVRIPEMALDQAEAHALAEAAANVQRLYPPKINEKMLAWGNLALCAGTVYGTRLIAIGARKKSERDPQAPQRSAPVLVETPVPTGSPMMFPGSGKLPT